MEQNEDIRRERGLRVADIRHLLRKSRVEFGEFLGISPYTLRSWEAGKFGGIPTKGVLLICEKAREYGLVCDKDWLMEGIGTFPTFSLSKIEIQENLREKEYLIIQEEIQHFKKSYPNSLVMEMTEDFMVPFLVKGTFIAGVVIEKKEYSNALNTTCIIAIEEKLICRQYLGKNEQGQYILQHYNTQEYYPAVEKIAPVIWVRNRRFF